MAATQRKRSPKPALAYANLIPVTEDNDYPSEGGIEAKRFRARVGSALDDEFNRMFGVSRFNVERALQTGSVKTSMWFIEVYMRHRGPRLANALVREIETTEEMIALSLKVLNLGQQGEISFDEVKNVQDAIARHIIMRTQIDLTEMRQKIEKLEGAMYAKSYGREHMPAWGRLKLVTESEGPDDDDRGAWDEDGLDGDYRDVTPEPEPKPKTNGHTNGNGKG